METLGCKHKTTPDHTTFSRILNEALDSAELEGAVSASLQSRSDPGEQVAIAGKTLWGTIGAGESQGQHLLSVYGTDGGLVMGQIAAGKKEDAMRAAPQVSAQ